MGALSGRYWARLWSGMPPVPPRMCVSTCRRTVLPTSRTVLRGPGSHRPGQRDLL